MKNLLAVFCVVSFICGCAATPYRAAAKPTSNGYYDTLLQPGVYDITFNANSGTSIKKAKDFALLRGAEVCLENGYKTFFVVNMEDNSKTETGLMAMPAPYARGEGTFYYVPVSETSPRISLIVQCSAEDDLFFKAADIKASLRSKYKIKD